MGGTPTQHQPATVESLPLPAKKTRHEQDNGSGNSGEGSLPQEEMSPILVDANEDGNVSDSSSDCNSGICPSHEVQNL